MKKTILLVTVCAILFFTVSISHAGLLGQASDYSAFIYGDLNVWSSDMEGRAAAGGNIDMTNYSVGGSADPADFSIVGGGNVTYHHGTIQNGGIFAGGNVELGNHTVNGGVTTNGSVTYTPGGGTVTGSVNQNAGVSNPIDFTAQFDYLKWLSGSLSSTVANGTTSVLYYAQTQITFTGSDDVNVFSLAGADLNNASNINFNVGDNIAIINVSGTADDFTSLGIAGTAGIQSNILWNFYEATNVTLNTSVKGSILAPNAHVDFNSAHIDGTIIADSLTGTGEFHKYDFDHNVPVAPEPISYVLFLTGGVVLGSTGYFRNRRTS